jgi:hypothetical protein
MLIRLDQLVVSIDESNCGQALIFGIRDGLSLDATLHTVNIPVECTLEEFAEHLADFSYQLRGYVS